MKTIEENRIYNEPCLDTLSRIPDNYVDCVITSPPYWQLRDYGYEGQWGLEPTFQEYLEHLWSFMDAIYPKLKDSGTVWVNLGDTYSTQSGSNLGISRGTHRITSGNLVKGKSMPSKCLLLIPHRFAIGCEDRGWIVRNDIIWAKRNGMPESVTDRFSKKHEYFFFMVKKQKYYFDLDIIRNNVNIRSVKRKLSKTKGPNPGDVSDFWDIPTKGTSANHYAAYNEDLIKIPILAGCPEGGVIYDPFMGIGTTAICAIRSNRKFIGSEMSKEYCNIANKNIEPYLLQKTIF